MPLKLHNPQTGWTRVFKWDMPFTTTADEYLIAYSIEIMQLEHKFNKNKVSDDSWTQLKKTHKRFLNMHKLMVECE